MSQVAATIGFVLCLVILPFLTIGLLRKIKALMQNRVGPPITQPLHNFLKLLSKTETVSEDASPLFRLYHAFNLSAILIVALLVPWVSFKPTVMGDDMILVIYLFALMRFFSLLSSLDSGSSFGAFASSREATISLMIEPVIILSFLALAFQKHSTSLGTIFVYAQGESISQAAIWILCGAALTVYSAVELSRMPVDDPCTHLELTMVHEAMILENSGRNLALAELNMSLKMTVLYGLCSQCFLHVINCVFPLNGVWIAALSIILILVMALFTALVESFSVKMQWTKVPEFIAYGLTLSLLACLATLVMRGLR